MTPVRSIAVSYTHLDVYKRQLYISPRCGEPNGEGATGSAGGAAEAIIRSPDCAVWLALLDEAVAGVGARGIHHVIAEIDEHSPEPVSYTHLDVYKRQPHRGLI